MSEEMKGWLIASGSLITVVFLFFMGIVYVTKVESIENLYRYSMQKTLGCENNDVVVK